MLLLSFNSYVITFISSRLFLLHQRLILVITVVKSFCDTFWLAQIKSSFLDVSWSFSFPALSIICATCMFFCSTAAITSVNASFISSFSVACSCFCSSSAFSSSLSCWRNESFFYFSAVSFPPTPFQAPLLYVIQLLFDVAACSSKYNW